MCVFVRCSRADFGGPTPPQPIGRRLLNRALETELTEHLRYPRGQAPPGGVGNVAICCAQHMRVYVACRTMLPSAECGRRCRGIGAYQRNIISARLTALEPRARRGWCDTGQAWRFGGLTRSSTHRLSSVLASTCMSAQSSDSWSDRSATVAMSNQPNSQPDAPSRSGHLAIDKGKTVARHTLETLAALFRRHRADDSISKAVSKLIRSDLILIDDVGLLPVSADAAEALFRVVDAAYEKRSIAISSNIHPSKAHRLE